MSSLGATATTESNDDDEAALGKAKAHKRWVQEIEFYETKAQQWTEKSKKILRRYKDERSPREQKVPRFNILWSNIQTLLPAMYSRRPKPDIERRFRDKDDLGRISSTVLERCISFFLTDESDNAIRQAVFDRLMSGRGTVWARYEPHFKDITENENEEVADDGYQTTDDSYGGDDNSEGNAKYSRDVVLSRNSLNVESRSNVARENDGPAEEIENEVICFDYVHWEDFGHTFGRTWEEVTAGWRKVYMTRSAGIERFGDKFKNVTLDYSPHDLKDNKYDEVEKKATIYEIWDKEGKKALWIHKDYNEGPLDEIDDPLQLTDFFPFPRPMFATLANDTCIPVPDYQEYQDQANELDEITSRIGAITRCIKVVGVFDASAPGIGRIMAEGVENQLVPVDQWAIFAEKGGMKGVMELLPMQDILQTLLGLYEARDKVKQDLYEITGIADIIRGATDANETAMAQQIKSQFGTLRLSANQDDVQRFVRELVKIGTEIIANHFSLETIKKICGVQLLTQADKQLVQTRMQILKQYQQTQQGAAQGGPALQGQQRTPSLPPQLPPLPEYLQKADQEDLAEMMENPTWEEVYALLKNEITLAYKIDIETDSTIKFDQEADRQARVEFLKTMGEFLQPAMQAPPELLPFLAKSLMFMMRGFKVGKELESAAELMIHKLEKQAENPQQKPDPEMAKVQGQMAIEQQKLQANMQMEQAKLQADKEKIAADAQAEAHRLQIQAAVDTNQAKLDAANEQLKQQAEAHSEQLEQSTKMAIAKMESETKLAVAQIQAKAQLQTASISKTTDESGGTSVDKDGNTVKQPSMAELMTTVVTQLTEQFNASMKNVAEGHQQLAAAMAKPKTVTRDQQGNITGVH